MEATAARHELEDAPARNRAQETHSSFLVQAPAGSGKTELLTQRFLRLLGEVDSPEQILAITFTRAATAEMRSRVLEALEEALSAPLTENDSPRIQAARAALKNDARHGWKLLEQPQQLNIQTIDSLCLTIAHNTPLLSRLGGSLTPTEHAQPLYALAARRTLARLGGEIEEISTAIRALLELRDTRLLDCEQLIAGMLACRDQWGRVLPLTQEPDWRQVQSALEAPLRREHASMQAKARRLFARHPAIVTPLFELLSFACKNLERHGSDSPLFPLNTVSQIEHLVERQHWNCLCGFLLTKEGRWRTRLNKDQGFPPVKYGGNAKEQFASLIAMLDREPEFLSVLCELRNLPPIGYSPEQWRLLKHMLTALRYAAAELRLIFAERNVVDFVELGMAARDVLTENNGEHAAAVAERWRHLLVDEFQDTSRAQYEMLALLVGGWESSSPGTCFLVGDPMQSIYIFRQAEVELFERTRKRGLGETHVELFPLQLQTNFRSHSGLVRPLNDIFAKVFTRDATIDPFAVVFAPSVARIEAIGEETSVHVTARFLDVHVDQEQKYAAHAQEADHVLAVIRSHWPAVEAAQREGREFRIAVLVRARQHLARIAARLRDAAIPFRAVEIEGLNQRQEVLDLAALTRALLHPMDRIAWLAVLRAPWCGLTLKDLHALCGSDDSEIVNEPVLELLRTRTDLLSSDGRKRASRVVRVLEDAIAGRHRQVSFSRWVERVWLTLGGRECVDRTGYENARVFFHMLEELPPDGTQLTEQIDRLFAEPNPHASERAGIQLLTIHKAKGLGFDIVIVPGLERKPGASLRPLLSWLERTRLDAPEEGGEREFLVAPIGRKGGEAEPLYQWIAQLKERREAEEAKRLFYVACTRARQELHLLGTATVKLRPDGSEVLEPGSSKSLLATAWLALEDKFAAAWRREKAARLGVSGQEAPPSEELPNHIPLRRLPVDWRPETRAVNKVELLVLESLQPASASGLFERPGGSQRARAFGSAVHALLEELAYAADEGVQNLSSEVESWIPRAQALLRHSGLSRSESEREASGVIRALTKTLEDAIGRWILGARRDGQAEISWSAWIATADAEALHTLRGDRVFRAGEIPGSQEETCLWIVDYKTARHGNAGVEEFLDREREKYQRQLSIYAQTLRKIHGEETLLRLALYYPLLQKLVWWAG